LHDRLFNVTGSDGDFITAACATNEEVLQLTHAEVWQSICNNKG